MQKDDRPILFAGGGTLGSVTPLLAIWRAWKSVEPDRQFLWVGTPCGPERDLVEREHISFVSLSVPKFDRAIRWQTLVAPVWFLWSLFASVLILVRERPAWILSAGAYVGVPLCLLGRLFGSRVAIHQLDAKVGLANRIVAPFAHVVTTSWPETARRFTRGKAEAIGSPVYVRSGSRVLSPSLETHKPILLILGGGTGSMALNLACERMADRLASEFQVVHATGEGKPIFSTRCAPDGYMVRDLLRDEFDDAIARADLVLSRAGMATIAELAHAGKASVLVPLPHSAQVANAQLLAEEGATLILHQPELLDADRVFRVLHQALDPHRRKALEASISRVLPTRGVAEKLVSMLLSYNLRR